MSRATKIIVYAGLILTGVIFAYCCSQEYTQVEIKAAQASKSLMMSYGAGVLLIVIGLGLLVALDVSQYFGNAAGEFVFNEDLDGVYDPAYEQAEKVWADGDHLEAIRLMREYLKKHPSEIHAALRIAEIYEQDLSNPLAAALEYEEILQQKLPRERWGWAAIHLCNLYSKLSQPDKSLALLRRIDTEYEGTAAARKARERLMQVEPENYSEPIEEVKPAEPEQPPAQVQTQPAAPSLPPGFRPKK